MTATELADELERMIPALPLSVLIKSVTMLRQQQAEIEALKEARCVACGWNPNLIGGERNDSGFYMSDAEHYKLKCESQQAEIDRLKSLCISYIDEEWSGTSSYQNKIDEVNNDCKKINR